MAIFLLITETTFYAIELIDQSYRLTLAVCKRERYNQNGIQYAFMIKYNILLNKELNMIIEDKELWKLLNDKD